MNPVEYLISSLAPHVCIGCGAEPNVLCSSCSSLLRPPPQLHLPTISTITSRTEYTGTAKEIIGALKYNRAKACAHTVAELIAHVLPSLPPNTVVCPIPTSSSRIRARGYDQAVLIARSLAREQKLRYKHILRKTTNTHQVGASRSQRIQQMKAAYRIVDHPPPVILLVDDIMTTGSSLQSAATLLKDNGAHEVHAAVFAYQPAAK